ncbi:MAG: hypothetical protein LC791_06010 [Acidobacteria bacterium]|nr:hypothetical protein [Acidobacteriota bacterium]
MIRSCSDARPFETRSRWAASTLAVVAVGWLAVAIGSDVHVPPFFPLGDQAIYQPTDSEARVAIEPILHAPWHGARSIFTSWALACGVIATGLLAALAMKASAAAACLACVALLVSAPFAASVRHASDPVLAVVLVWLSWALTLRGIGRSDGWLVFLAAIVWGVSVAMTWLALIVAPIVLLACVSSRRTPRARALATAGVLLMAGAGLGAYAARVSLLTNAASDPGARIGLIDVWRVAFGDLIGRGEWRFAAADIAGLSLLSAALAIAGVTLGQAARWWQRGVVFSGALLAVIWLEWPPWRAEALQWTSWASMPLVATGLTWAATQMSPPWGIVVSTALAAVLIGGNVGAAVRPLGGGPPRAFAVRLEATLDDLRRSRPIALIAEDTLVDSALAAWAGAPRLSQHPDAPARALARGLEPLAGPSARAHLELAGYRFERAASIDDPAPYILSRVAERFRCATIRSDRWSLLPGVEYTGRLGLYVPPGLGASLVLIVGDELPLQLGAALASGRTLALKQQALLKGPGSGAPPPDYWFDNGDPALAPQNVTRVTLPAHPVNSTIAGLFLGRRAPRVLARLDGHPDHDRGSVCAAPLGPDALWGRDATREVRVALETSALFGMGWYGLEGDAHDRFRWTSSDAAVLVPSAIRSAVRVRLDAAPAAEPDASGPMLTLQVNGMREAELSMRPGLASYDWEIPASHWLQGTNELLFSLSRSVRPSDQGAHDTRVLGMRVHGIMLTRQ